MICRIPQGKTRQLHAYTNGLETPFPTKNQTLAKKTCRKFRLKCFCVYVPQLAASAQPQKVPALRDATGAPFLRPVPIVNL